MNQLPRAALILLCFCFLLTYSHGPALPLANASQTASTSQSGGGTNNPDDTVYRSATVLRYTTRLVVVDVIATDHKGNPVTDLQKQDFTVQEDGKNQDVELFTLQKPGQEVARAPVQSGSKLPPGAVTNVPQYDVTRTLTVLLLDSLNTETKNQVNAREQMLKFIERLPQDQPIAVYTLGSRLRLVQDFTSDPAVLKKVVMAVETHNSALLENPTGSGGGSPSGVAPGAMETLEQTLPAMAQQIQQFQQESTVMQTDLRVQLTVSAFKALARGLAGYPGRKNLVWLSQSFPLSIQATEIPVAGARDAPSARTQLNNRDYAVESAQAATALADAQVAVYPVDVGSLVGNQVYASLSPTDDNGNYLGRTLSGNSPGGNRAAGDELNRTPTQQFDAHSSMNDVAERTGGKAFYNQNDVENAIRKTLDDGSVYYTLAYHPQNKDWNGKFRKISVKVQRSGIHLRYRLGYYAVDPQAFEKMDPRQRNVEFGQAFSRDFPVSTAISFQANVAPPSGETKGKVVVNYRIDPRMILFESDAQGQHAEIDYAVAAYPKAGGPPKMQGQTMKTAFPPDAFQQITRSYLPCQLQFELPPGDYILRLGVRDDHTGLIGTADTLLTVPQAPHTP